MQPEHLRKLTRKWAIPIVLLALIGAAAGYYVTGKLTPIYQATGNVLVVAAPGQAAGTGSVSVTANEATTTAATLITEPALLQGVITQLHLKTTTAALGKEVTATPETNSELVDVVVHDPSAARAAQIANALTSTYVTEVITQNTQRINQAGAVLQAQIDADQATLAKEQQQLQAAKNAGKDTTVLTAEIDLSSAQLSQATLTLSSIKATQAEALETVSVAALATAPTSPISPNRSINTALGGFVGLLLAIALAAIFQYFDQGLKNPDDVLERLGVPCLAVIPRFSHLAVIAERNTKRKRQSERVMEAYRRLRTNLLFSSPDIDLETVVITSAQPGEGKTCTAANLAVALASSEKRVLLVDADLRNPGQHLLFRKSLDGGLSELIMQGKVNPLARLLRTHATDFPNLSLLTSGTIPPNPSELLESRRARTLLTELAEDHDLLVIDTAPAGAVSDALSVAAYASATILVVEAGKTNASHATAVIRSLRDVGANVIGVVINKAPRGSLAHRYGYSPYPYGSKSLRGSAAPPQAAPTDDDRRMSLEPEAAAFRSRKANV
jgi:succinoglycan biosynthesis transport protein ExoP